MSFLDSMEIDRRKFLIKAGSGVIGTAILGLSIKTILDNLDNTRTLPQRIPRTVGERNIPVPKSWVDGDNALERVSVEGMPLDKAKIDSLPIAPYNERGKCKSGETIDVKGYGITIPDMYEELGKKIPDTSTDYIVIASDGYALVLTSDGAKKALFSASKDNIPKDYWSGEGFEIAKKVKMTPYGVLPQDGKAWHNNSDTKHISSYKGDFEPGTYFVYPNGEIIKPENKDISMTLDNLVLTLVDKNNNPTKLSYSKIKLFAENHSIKYKIKGKEQKVPYLPMRRILEYANTEQKNITLILHANNYAVSIPPWRQDNLGIIFDKYYEKYGTPAKVIGEEFLNKAAQAGGVYKIEVKPMKA